MHRSIAASVLFVLAFQPLADVLADQPASPTNVLMICIDDLNDWVGFLGGHPEAITPHMDALAKRGRVFRERALPRSCLFRLASQRDVGRRRDDAREL